MEPTASTNPATIDLALELDALRAHAGAPVGERALAVFVAVPADGAWTPSVTQTIQIEGGRIHSFKKALIAAFPQAVQAIRCANSLQRTGVIPDGRLAIGFCYGPTPVSETGIPVGRPLENAVTLASVAKAGQVLVTAETRPHLGDARIAHHSTVPTPPVGELDIWEVAWRSGQKIGRTTIGKIGIAAAVVAMMLIGIAVAKVFDDMSNDRKLIAYLADAGQNAPLQPLVLKDYDDAGQAAAPEPTPPSTPTGALAVSALPDAGAASAEAPPAKAPAKRTGTLTLITIPEAKAKLKGANLGTTPFFKVAVPEGTHRIELTGPDGQVHLLSVPITAGQNTALRLKLDELPTK